MQSSKALPRKPFSVQNLACGLVTLSVIVALGGFFAHKTRWDRSSTVVIKASPPPPPPPPQPSPASASLIEDATKSSLSQNEPQQGSGEEGEQESDDDRRLRLPDWFLNYTAFHREALRSLRNPSTSHAKKNKYKSLIWICRRPSPSRQVRDSRGTPVVDSPAAPETGSCGGTGDRLGGLLHALFMAMCTDRLFFIDWRYPSSLDGFLEPNHLQWNVSAEWLRYVEDDVWRLSAMDDYHNRYLLDPDSLPKNQSTIEVRTNIWTGQIHHTSCMRNYLSRFEPSSAAGDPSRNLTSEDYFRMGFEALFRWSDAVRDHTERIRSQLNLEPSTPAVAIHLRTGLGETFHDVALPTAEADVWPLYYHCARRVRDALSIKCGITHLSDGGIPMYLATDAAVVRQHYSAYNDPALRFVNGTPVYHLDRTVRSRLGKDADESELQVWTDLQLLVESSCLVYTDRSKFSRLGRWLHHPPSVSSLSSSSASTSHPARRPRCAFTFNQCRDRDVQRLMAELDANELCLRPPR